MVNTIPACSAEDIVAAVRAQLYVTPCHTTGEHDPDHTGSYLCGQQQKELLSRLLGALGVELGDLGHRLHKPGTCFWCHHVPGQEEYREQQRTLYRWAGAEITGELAQPAPDAPRDGDEDLILAALTDEYQPWPKVLEEMGIDTSTHSDVARLAVTRDRLGREGRIEWDHSHGINGVRLAQS